MPDSIRLEPVDYGLAVVEHDRTRVVLYVRTLLEDDPDVEDVARVVETVLGSLQDAIADLTGLPWPAQSGPLLLPSVAVRGGQVEGRFGASPSPMVSISLDELGFGADSD
jgi:hypothetical protein